MRREAIVLPAPALTLAAGGNSGAKFIGVAEAAPVTPGGNKPRGTRQKARRGLERRLGQKVPRFKS